MKNIHHIIILIMSIIGMANCTAASAADSYIDKNVSEFNDYIKEPGVQLIDVRTPEEYAEGHIAGSTNINYYASNFVTECENELDKNRPVAVYCRSGHRSGLAARVLSKAGYNVTNLEGGILAWNAANMPTIK